MGGCEGVCVCVCVCVEEKGLTISYKNWLHHGVSFYKDKLPIDVFSTITI